LRPHGAACAALAAGTRPAGAAAAQLYWSSAPPSGGDILLDSERSRTLRLAAAARDRKQQVRVSLLGKTPGRLVTRAGNPAVATLRFPFPRTFQPRTFVVTLVVEVKTTTVSLVGPGVARERDARSLAARLTVYVAVLPLKETRRA
jgi:hypothetical protein